MLCKPYKNDTISRPSEHCKVFIAVLYLAYERIDISGVLIYGFSCSKFSYIHHILILFNLILFQDDNGLYLCIVDNLLPQKYLQPI